MKYLFISIISSLFSIFEVSGDVCRRFITDRDLTIIFSRVDEPIDADKVNDENKY
jgi:hypothetical protein